MMKAIIADQPGGADVLRLAELPKPEAAAGRVLIRVRAFGLNRAELFTRRGDSPSVKFPRVIGIECVGEVENDPDGRLAPGQKVAAMMGGMGRDYDGSYAEYTSVPFENVIPIRTNLDWARFAAIPEMFQTANGSLKHALRVEPGKSLLIRGGTSSVGMTAITLAKNRGLFVIATTRKRERAQLLREQGADEVVIDTGSIGRAVRAIRAEGVDYVLELIGVKTLDDSLGLLAPGGKVCMTGILSGEWNLNNWNPMEHIPNGCYLTSYSGTGISREDLQELTDQVESGALKLNLHRVFAFEEIRAAHEYMEANKATGKLVVLVDS